MATADVKTKRGPQLRFWPDRSIGGTLLLVAAIVAIFLWAPRLVVAQDQSVAIGFSEELPLSSLLDSPHPSARIVRSATGGVLLKPTGAGAARVDFKLAQSFSVSSDGRIIRLRLRSGAQFSDREPVRPADVVFSLRRCMSRWSGPGSPERVSEGVDTQAVFSGGEVQVTLGTATQSQFWEFLAECPIYEAEAARLFGSAFGAGTNVVGSGAFVLTSFRSRPAEIVLRRLSQTGVLRGQAIELTLRSMEDAERGLSALRIGTISAFFTEDSVVLGKAANDETLFASKCFGYSVLKRRGFVFPCEHGIDLEAITWGDK